MKLNLTTLLARWPEGRHVVSVVPVNERGFSGAVVFRVQSETGEFALRRWPDDSIPTARIRELHRFLNFLHRNGIEIVAVPLADETGATVISHEGRRWQLEPWMAGSAISRHPTPTQLTHVMRALARLHLAAAEYEPTVSGRQWFFQDRARVSPAVIERLQLIRDWSEDRLRTIVAVGGESESIARSLLQPYVRARPAIARELESCASMKVHVHPCLRDVHREHVLVSGPEVTGFIDPSAARSENVASDLSRLLGDLLGSGPWERALAAYSEVRPLSEDERRLARVLDRSGVLLSALTWIRHTVAETPDHRARMRIDRIQQRLQSLADSIDGTPTRLSGLNQEPLDLTTRPPED